MKIRENEAFGTTVIVDEGESLDAVPDSHREMVDPTIVRIFANPRKWVRDTASRCRSENMRRWLDFMAADGRCKLLLEEARMMDRITRAGLFLWSDKVRCAIVTPPVQPSLPNRIEAFSRYYSLIDVLDWERLGSSGGVFGSRQHVPLPDYWTGDLECGTSLDELRVWGSSDSGDMLVHATDRRAGWLSHESGRIHWLGDIDDAIDWVFGELMANRTPAFDYDWF